jgi:peroxiredoxin
VLVRSLASALALSVACVACGPGATSPGQGSTAANAGSSSSPLEGKAAPEISRRDLDGERFVLSSARGRVAVVKFIAKNCAPCQRTLPAMERLHREHPDIVIVGVSEDDTEDDARALASLHKLTFPVVQDSGNVLAGRYRVTELPVTFVIDRAGTIVWVGGPEKSERELVGAALGVR